MGLILIIGAGLALILGALYISNRYWGKPQSSLLRKIEWMLTMYLIIGFTIYSLNFFIDREKEDFLQESFRHHLSNIQNSQELYFKKHGSYAREFQDLNLQVPNTMEFFLSEKDFPLHYNYAVNPKNKPYATNNDYQIVGVILRRSGKNPEILIQPKNGPLRGLDSPGAKE